MTLAVLTEQPDPLRLSPTRRCVTRGAAGGVDKIMAFIELIPLSACRAAGGTFVRHADRKLAVFRLTDPQRIFVIDSECPHAGGDLSKAELAGYIVTCPWHYWQFDLRTGVSTHSDRACVRRYPAEIRDDVVWVDLPE